VCYIFTNFSQTPISTSNLNVSLEMMYCTEVLSTFHIGVKHISLKNMPLIFLLAIKITRLINKILLNYFTVNITELASLQLVLKCPCWPSIYGINQNMKYSMTLRPYVYTNLLDSVIFLISFGCLACKSLGHVKSPP